MLYRITDATLSAGSEIVLTHFNMEIKGRDRLAIVGPNGAGKTTLLRLIAGELSPDRDDHREQAAICQSRPVTTGLLRQDALTGSDRTLQEEIMAICPAEDPWSRERFDFEQAYDRLLTGFGLTKADKVRPIASFSGGERTRIALIRLLLMQPEILLLDEPTNHLDMEMVRWLEDYLKSYPGAVVIVSHDRFFLDETAETIYEIQGQQLVRYHGGYSAYREEKLKTIERQTRRLKEWQEEMDRNQDLIRRFKNKPNKAAFARSRKKQMERMGRPDPPPADGARIHTGDLLPAAPGPKWVLEAEKLVPGYDRGLFELSLRVKRGQKIGIIGPNGAGKSTLLKTIIGQLPPVGGRLTLGEKLTVGYFDQHSSEITSEETVPVYFTRHFPSADIGTVRHYLASYLFEAEDLGKQVRQLSGGERARLVLALMLYEPPACLILDEPTNHMDIPARETLESVFKSYKGTILFVSHDRYFLQQVAESLLILEDGAAAYYPFGYRHYLERQKRAKERAQGSPAAPAALLRAEDQALLSSLKAVPKGSSLLGHALSDDQTYLEWQLGLALARLREAEAALLETEPDGIPEQGQQFPQEGQQTPEQEAPATERRLQVPEQGPLSPEQMENAQMQDQSRMTAMEILTMEAERAAALKARREPLLGALLEAELLCWDLQHELQPEDAAFWKDYRDL